MLRAHNFSKRQFADFKNCYSAGLGSLVPIEQLYIRHCLLCTSGARRQPTRLFEKWCARKTREVDYTRKNATDLLHLHAWYRYDIIAVSDCFRQQTVQNWRYQTGTVCWVVRAVSVWCSKMIQVCWEQTVAVCISISADTDCDHHSCYRGRYIILNRPDISAVECCNRACVFPCVLSKV